MLIESDMLLVLRSWAVPVIFLPLMQAFAAEPVPPLRKAVDIYNSVGSKGRLLALMKIGATESDRRYLIMMHSRLKSASMPRAFLAGQLVYFKNREHPLEVIDLSRGLFALRGRKFDLNFKSGLQAKLEALNKVAGEDMGAELMAVAGLAVNSHCLMANGQNCVRRFLGLVTALGEVGGLKGRHPVEEVFCIPGDSGQPRFVASGKGGANVAINQEKDQLWLESGNYRRDVSSNRSARALMATCRSREQLESLNVALAFEQVGGAR